MKKVYFFTVMLAMSVVANVQAQGSNGLTEVSTSYSEEYCYVIPKDFTFGKNFYLSSSPEGFYLSSSPVSFPVYVYNDDFEIVKTINVTHGVRRCLYRDFDGNSFPTDNDSGTFYLTQTLFNDDEKFEYIRNSSEGGFEIVSEDGTVLQTCKNDDLDGGPFNIYRMNGKLYLGAPCYADLIEDDKGDYVVLDKGDYECLYKIDKQTTRIKRVAEIPVPTTRYSVAGYQLPSTQSGVNIVRQEDGTVKKVLVE